MDKVASVLYITGAQILVSFGKQIQRNFNKWHIAQPHSEQRSLFVIKLNFETKWLKKKIMFCQDIPHRCCKSNGSAMQLFRSKNGFSQISLLFLFRWEWKEIHHPSAGQRKQKSQHQRHWVQWPSSDLYHWRLANLPCFPCLITTSVNSRNKISTIHRIWVIPHFCGKSHAFCDKTQSWLIQSGYHRGPDTTLLFAHLWAGMGWNSCILVFLLRYLQQNR